MLELTITANDSPARQILEAFRRDYDKLDSKEVEVKLSEKTRKNLKKDVDQLEERLTSVARNIASAKELKVSTPQVEGLAKDIRIIAEFDKLIDMTFAHSRALVNGLQANSNAYIKQAKASADATGALKMFDSEVVASTIVTKQQLEAQRLGAVVTAMQSNEYREAAAAVAQHTATIKTLKSAETELTEQERVAAGVAEIRAAEDRKRIAFVSQLESSLQGVLPAEQQLTDAQRVALRVAEIRNAEDKRRLDLLGGLEARAQGVLPAEQQLTDAQRVALRVAEIRNAEDKKRLDLLGGLEARAQGVLPAEQQLTAEQRIAAKVAEILAKHERERVNTLAELQAAETVAAGGVSTLTREQRQAAAVVRLLGEQEEKLATLMARGDDNVRAMSEETENLSHQQRMATLRATELNQALLEQERVRLRTQDPEIAPIITNTQRMRMDAGGQVTGFRLANQAATAFRATMQGLNAYIGIYSSGTIVAAVASYKLMEAIRSTISTGAEFTEKMSMASAVMEGTGQQYKAVESEVLRLGATTRLTATEVAGGLIELAQAGLTSEEAIAALGPTLQLSIIGMMDFGSAADIATNVMTSFGMKAEDLGHVVDVMAKAAVDSNLTVKQLGNTLSYAAPVAEAYGVSLEQVVAASMMLANAGIKASRGGTTMRRTIDSLYTPTKKGEEAMQRLGVSITDVFGRTKEFSDILLEFARATNNATTNVGELGDIVSLYALPGFLRMVAGASDAEKGIVAFTESLAKAQGVAAAMSAVIANNLTGDFKALKSAVENLELKIFDDKENSLRDFTKALTVGVRGFAGMEDVSKKVANAILELVRVVGLLIGLGALGGLIKMVNTANRAIGVGLIGTIGLLGSRMNTATGAVGLFAGALSALSVHPIGRWLALLGAGVGVVYSLFNDTAGAASDFYSEVSKGFTVVDEANARIEKMATVNGKLVDELKRPAQVIENMKDTIQTTLDEIKRVEDQMSALKAVGADDKDPQVENLNKQLDALKKSLRDQEIGLKHQKKIMAEQAKEVAEADLKRLQRLKEQEEVIMRSGRAEQGAGSAAFERSRQLAAEAQLRSGNSAEKLAKAQEEVAKRTAEASAANKEFEDSVVGASNAVGKAAGRVTDYGNGLVVLDDAFIEMTKGGDKAINALLAMEKKYAGFADAMIKYEREIEAARRVRETEVELALPFLSEKGREEQKKILEQAKADYEQLVSSRTAAEQDEIARLNKFGESGKASDLIQEMLKGAEERREVIRGAIKDRKDELTVVSNIAEVERFISDILENRDVAPQAELKAALVKEVEKLVNLQREYKKATEIDPTGRLDETKAMEDNVEAQKKVVAYAKKRIDTLKSLKVAYIPAAAAAEFLEDKERDLNALMKVGVITAEKKAELMEKYQRQAKIMAQDNEFSKTLAQWEDDIANLDKVGADWLTRFKDAIVDWAAGAKGVFKSFFQYVVRSLLDLAAKVFVVNVLGLLGMGAVAGPGKGGSVAGGVVGSVGGVFGGATGSLFGGSGGSLGLLGGLFGGSLMSSQALALIAQTDYFASFGTIAGLAGDLFAGGEILGGLSMIMPYLAPVLAIGGILGGLFLNKRRKRKEKKDVPKIQMLSVPLEYLGPEGQNMWEDTVNVVTPFARWGLRAAGTDEVDAQEWIPFFEEIRDLDQVISKGILIGNPSDKSELVRNKFYEKIDEWDLINGGEDIPTGWLDMFGSIKLATRSEADIQMKEGKGIYTYYDLLFQAGSEVGSQFAKFMGKELNKYVDEEGYAWFDEVMDALNDFAARLTAVFKDLDTYANSDLLEEYNKQLKLANETIYDRAIRLKSEVGTALDEAVSDLLIEKAEKLSELVRARYESEMQLLSQINDLTKGIKESTTSIIEQIKLDTFDEQSKYDYYKEKAEIAANKISGATDPADVQKYAEEAMAAASQAWGLMPDDIKKALRSEYEIFFTEMQAVSLSSLEQAQAATLSDAEITRQLIADFIAGTYVPDPTAEAAVAGITETNEILGTMTSSQQSAADVSAAQMQQQYDMLTRIEYWVQETSTSVTAIQSEMGSYAAG